MALRLTIKREGSLLSVIRDQELTGTQLLAIEIVLNNERVVYSVVENDRITKLAEEYPELFGIEQYQAESR